jgi:hypothetical protein
MKGVGVAEEKERKTGCIRVDEVAAQRQCFSVMGEDGGYILESLRGR